MAVITISRDPGAFGEELAARLAGKLGFLLIDKAHLVRLRREMDLSETSLERIDEIIPSDSAGIDSETEAMMRVLPNLIAQIAEDHDLVVLGRGCRGCFTTAPEHCTYAPWPRAAFRWNSMHKARSARRLRRIFICRSRTFISS
jgi:hypothetical protein